MANAGEEYLRELDELQASPEWALLVELRALRHTYTLHEGNYRDLIRLLEAVERDQGALSIWEEERRDLLDSVLQETARLLHNFVASAKTLVDHTRNHVRRLYSGKSFLNKYERRKNRLIKSPVVNFIQDLRDYSLHYRFPGPSAELRIDAVKGTVENSLRLESSKLRKWKGWNHHARTYFAEHPESVDLRLAIDGYMALIKEFYDWLTSEEEKIHSKKLSSLSRRYDHLQALSNQRQSQDAESAKPRRHEHAPG